MADDAALLKSVHKALINFDKRAERASDTILAATFVDSEPLYDLLNSKQSGDLRQTRNRKNSRTKVLG